MVTDRGGPRELVGIHMHLARYYADVQKNRQSLSSLTLVCIWQGFVVELQNHEQLHESGLGHELHPWHGGGRLRNCPNCSSIRVPSCA